MRTRTPVRIVRVVRKRGNPRHAYESVLVRKCAPVRTNCARTERTLNLLFDDNKAHEENVEKILLLCDNRKVFCSYLAFLLSYDKKDLT